MQVDGSCHCGSIEYRAEIDPERVIVCHCTDCQILSGSAFRVVAFTREDAFTLTRGTPKTYVKIAESGRQREQGFCGHCGSALYATAPGAGPKVYGLRVGTLRQRRDHAVGNVVLVADGVEHAFAEIERTRTRFGDGRRLPGKETRQQHGDAPPFARPSLPHHACTPWVRPLP